MVKSYWEVSLQELCGDLDIPYSDELLDGIIGIRDCESLGCGYDVSCCGTTNSEIEQLKREIKKIKHDHDMQLMGIVNNYCKANNRDIDSVYIDGDSLMFKHNLLV